MSVIFTSRIAALTSASLTLLLLIACGKATPTPEAKQAIEELQRLQSRTEVGINQVEYSKEIADVKFAIEKFQSTEEAGSRLEFAKHLNAALGGHLLLLEFLRECPEDCTESSKSLTPLLILSCGLREYA